MQNAACSAGRESRGAGGCCRQRLGEAALGRAFGGFLQDLVGDQIGTRRQGCAMRGAGRLPLGVDRLAVQLEERLFQEQPDGEEVGDGGVRAAGELGLPQLVAGVLRPAAEAHQELVEIRLDGGAAEPEACGCTGRGLPGTFWRVGHETAEAGEAQDLGRQVMGGDGPPGGIGALAAGCCPKCLALVEIAGGPGAEALGDQAGPIDAGDLCREVGHGRHRCQRRCRCRRCGLERCDIVRTVLASGKPPGPLRDPRR